MIKTLSAKKREMDMTTGPIFPKILIFSIPLMLSSMLQLLFNTVNMIVVGRFADEASLAAVSSTGSVVLLIINMFIGLSVGTNVLTGQAIGAKDNKMASDTVHTSVSVSLAFGVFLAALGFVIIRPILLMMDTPADVIDKATIYMQIYFLSMPAMMLYNFGYAVMRAIGDTKRPMYYLIYAGIANVVFGVLFVRQFRMDVVGVALATIISQTISAALIVRDLTKLDSEYKLDIRKLRINGKVMLQMIKIGLPAGIQSTLFSISHVIIQSSINSFGKLAMAGNGAASNTEGFVYAAMAAFNQASVSFTSQNYGAGNFDRIKKVFIQCVLGVTGAGILLSIPTLMFADKLLPLYSTEPGVVEYGIIRLNYICTTYFLCGIMETIAGSIRGLGSSIAPTIISLIWACFFRVIWIFTVFEKYRTLDVLYLSYPISWIMTSVCLLVYFVWFYKRVKNRTSVEI